MMVSVSLPALSPFVKAGRLRGIAVTSAKRSSYMPETPHGRGAGLPGVRRKLLAGADGPGGMPPAVVARINGEVNKAMQAAEVREQFIAQGAEPAGGTQQQFVDLVKREIKEWADVVRKVGIKPQ